METNPEKTASRIKKYKNFRSIGMELNSNIFKYAVETQITKRAASSLKMLSGKTIVVDDEDQVNVLSECSIYEIPKLGKPIVGHFADQNSNLDENQTLLIAAMIKSQKGLFRVENTLPEENLLELQEVVGPKRKLFLTDIGMSMSLLSGMIIFIRPIEIEDLVMTSGIGFVFPSEMEDELIKRWQKLKPTERFSNFFRLHRIKGIPTHYEQQS